MGRTWGIVKRFCCFLIERNELIITTAFDGLGAVPIVGQKVFYRREQKRSELTVTRIRSRVGFGPQKEGEEALRQVLRIRRTITAPTDKTIDWRPIHFA